VGGPRFLINKIRTEAPSLEYPWSILGVLWAMNPSHTAVGSEHLGVQGISQNPTVSPPTPQM
jgi:hypothetical protein